MVSASNPISHYTSHTLANGASSSNAGSRGDSENRYGCGKSGCEGADFSKAPLICYSHNQPDLKIIDSTLREGEQFSTAYFDSATKIKIAKALDNFGVEYVSALTLTKGKNSEYRYTSLNMLEQIELTSPAAFPRSRADCEAICKLNLRAKVLTHIRCHMDDARIAVQTGVDGVNVYMGTSPQLMQHSHGKDMAYITSQVKEVIQFIKAHNLEIRFSGEDSFRSDFSEILKLYSTMDQLGVDRVGIADTVGGATPFEVLNKVHKLRESVSCDIETHFHNDTGCAIANAYCAFEAGATHVDTTVLGIGERNGITSLGGLIACLIAADCKDIVSKYRLETLATIEAVVAEAAGIEIPFNDCKVASLAGAPVIKPKQAY